MLEKHIERQVCEYARHVGMLVYKFTSPQRRSVPDRIVVTNKGVVFFIEFKAPGKGLTDGQAREIARLRGNNVRVFVCDNVEYGKEIIDTAVSE